MEFTLKRQTLRSESVVLPMSVVHTVVQRPGADYTELVVRIPGKSAEARALEFVRRARRGELTRVPRLPPPPGPAAR